MPFCPFAHRAVADSGPTEVHLMRTPAGGLRAQAVVDSKHGRGLPVIAWDKPVRMAHKRLQSQWSRTKSLSQSSYKIILETL